MCQAVVKREICRVLGPLYVNNLMGCVQPIVCGLNDH